jgi:sigma-B regulation protein RsbU (phosphoserine phosphatase)
MTVPRPTPSHLRLYREPAPEAAAVPDGVLDQLCREFSAATGWPLRWGPGAQPAQSAHVLWSLPLETGLDHVPQHLRMETSDACVEGLSPGEPAAANRLAMCIAGLWNELTRTRVALWQREAELAAGVPLKPHADEPSALAARLQSIVRGAAVATHCTAGGLYLLDEGTSHLKLRSLWGLPLARLADAPRPLSGAKADLEAMLGHVVAMEDEQAVASWKAPEPAASALCVPVASPTQILGTLWLFASVPRPFDDRDSQIAELAAGRMAVELERAMLLQQQQEDAERRRQWSLAESICREQSPPAVPPLDGWELAGWTHCDQPPGGAFHDWQLRADGRLLVAASSVAVPGAAAAVPAAALRAALRSHALHAASAAELLHAVARTYWDLLPKAAPAELVVGMFDPRHGQLDVAWAGSPTALHFTAHNWLSLLSPQVLLGQDPHVFPGQFSLRLGPGECLVLGTSGLVRRLDASGRPLGDRGLAVLTLKHQQGTASQLAESLRAESLHRTAPGPLHMAASLIVLRAATRD